MVLTHQRCQTHSYHTVSDINPNPWSGLGGAGCATFAFIITQISIEFNTAINANVMSLKTNPLHTTNNECKAFVNTDCYLVFSTHSNKKCDTPPRRTRLSHLKSEREGREQVNSTVE